MTNEVHSDERAYLIDGYFHPHGYHDSHPTLTEEEFIKLQRVGIAYAIAVLGEPPEGTRLDVIVATHHYDQKFVTLAHLFPTGMEVGTEYSDRVGGVVRRFDSVIKWEVLERDYWTEFEEYEHKNHPSRNLHLYKQTIADSGYQRGSKVVIRRGTSDEILYEANTNTIDLNLQHKDLHGANLASMVFNNGDFTGVNLSEANLMATILSQVQLSRAVLTSATMDYAFLGRSRGDSIDFRGTSLVNAIAYACEFEDADFRGANLTGARVHGNFTRANMDGATMVHVRCAGSNFKGSTFRSADLSCSNLRHSSFDGADLDGANLSRADLRQINLSKARLIGSNLSGAIYDNGTKWPENFDPSAEGAVWVPHLPTA